MEEMSLVFGGWKYDGEHEWLKGQNIACPYCHNGDKNVVEFQNLLGPSSAAFNVLNAAGLFPFRCVRRLQKNKAGRSFVINA